MARPRRRGRASDRPVKYELRPGFKIPKRLVQAIGEELQRHGIGALHSTTPERLLEIANDPNSVLRPFIYNRSVREAAHEYYLTRARYIMRALDVVYIDGRGREHRSRMMHAVYDQEIEATTYANNLHVYLDPDSREQVRARARREMEGWVQRYRQYNYLSRAVEQGEAVLQRL